MKERKRLSTTLKTKRLSKSFSTVDRSIVVRKWNSDQLAEGRNKHIQWLTEAYYQPDMNFIEDFIYKFFDNLITFIDRRLFTKQPYLEVGFEFIKNTKPKSFYTKQGQKIRMKDWKDYCKNIDSEKTPQENLENNKFYKVYDCGCIKMQWKRG